MSVFAKRVVGLPVWAWLAMGVVAGVVVWQRRRVMFGLRFVAGAAEELRFKLALPAAGRPYASVILRVSREEGVPPAIIAGLMSRESGFGAGLTPPGPGGTGDEGHGRGLMQIDDRWHPEFIASGKWKDPYENVKYGVRLLKANIRGFEKRGLKGDRLYAAALAAYNAGSGSVQKALAAGQSPDARTTGGNYGQDVVRRAAEVERKRKATV